MRYDTTLFAQTAAYYTRYRLPYPEAMFEHLQRALAFDGRGMALDLGCGPGRLALELAGKFEKIVGIDPDDEMLTEARKAAQAAGAANVKFLKGSSWDLSPELGRFRFAIMGQAFHWIRRRLRPQLRPKGLTSDAHSELRPRMR